MTGQLEMFTDSSLMLRDGLITQTFNEQQNVEILVEREKKKSVHKESSLFREAHIDYILRGLNNLPKGCMSMDSSRSWFCFWGLHSLRLLRYNFEKNFEKRMITFLKACQVDGGGYAGAPGQFPHLATTYASVMALVSIGSDEALNSIDRIGLRKFIMSMKQENGAFSVHKGGETDVRAAYCAIAVAHICNLSNLEELFGGTQTWLSWCQTYEGGFGGEPNCEAHGGYTFCALAGLALMQKIHLVNTDDALKWLVNRQMRYEGGFQGRTNKLVDVCYSYWQAACFCALECQIFNKDDIGKSTNSLFNTLSLQSYILDVCQSTSGGFSDKPDKQPDMYHTCYSLSGLSIAQSYTAKKQDIVGGESNFLELTHPLYNVTLDSCEKAIGYFNSMDQS